MIGLMTGSNGLERTLKFAVVAWLVGLMKTTNMSG